MYSSSARWLQINHSDPIFAANEFYPSVTWNKKLYFTVARDHGLGGEDIYRARYEDGQYVDVENLGEGVNSAADEFNAFVAPHGDFIIFSAQGRKPAVGGGDLYISQRRDDGKFGRARLLSGDVNSVARQWLGRHLRGAVQSGRI